MQDSGYELKTWEVMAEMQSPMVKSILDTGVDRNIVKQVIERRLRKKGKNYSNPNALMEAVLKLNTNHETISSRPMTGDTNSKNDDVLIDSLNLQVALEDEFIPPDIPSLPSNYFPSNARFRRSNEGRQVKYRVLDEMQLPMVQAILDTGVQWNHVKDVIERRLKEKGENYPTSEALLNAVLNLEKDSTAVNIPPFQEEDESNVEKMLTEARALERSYREPSVPQDNQSSSSFPINATLLSLNAEDNEQNVDDLLIELLAIEENNRGFHVPQDIESSFSYPSSSNANGGQRMDDQTTLSQMQLPMVQAILDTGFDRKSVMQAIQRRLRETGDNYPNSEALLDAVLNLQHSPEDDNVSLSREMVSTDIPPPPSHLTLSGDSDHSSTLDLETENNMLRQKTQCKLCLDADARFHFRPCGHLCCCETCASRVTTCPVCRANIDEKLKIYYS